MFQCPAPIINIPQAQQNHEWLKILLTVMLGFILGLLAEPIKRWLEWRNEAKRIQRAVAYDVLLLFTARTSMKHGLIAEDTFWQNIEIPAFEKHWDENREYFYSNIELITKSFQLRMVGILKKGIADGKISREDATKKLDGVIAELMKIPAPNAWRRFRNQFRRKPATQTSASPEEKSDLPDSDSLDGQ